jgi:hypothetical protein
MNTHINTFPHRLASLLSGLRELHTLRVLARRVDGGIVGTGQADFTVSNVSYRFGSGDRSFCLMDVPGIEGNESSYAELVRDALAKAHAVFYVNGTNKKPEAETAGKIAEYLRHDTMVHPIINVRGKADAYEFDADRISITASHADVVKNAELTEEVLRERVGEDAVRPAILVQGIAALSASALHEGMTTLVPERVDLLRAQKGMLEAFGDPGHLREFSQIDEVSDLLLGYANGGGWNAIAAANRRRILRLVRNALIQLNETIKDNADATVAVSTNVDAYSNAIVTAVKRSKVALHRSAGVATNTVFAKLRDSISVVIKRDFQSKDKAKNAADREITAAMNSLREKIESLASKFTAELHVEVAEAIERLKIDLANIRDASLKIHREGFELSLSSAMDAIDFQLTDAGKLLANMAGYAVTGATLGATGGPVGVAIGSAIGALVGALVEIGMYFGFGRDKKIREAQTKALSSLDKSAGEIKEQVGESIKRQYAEIQKVLDRKILEPLSNEVHAMKHAGASLARQRDLVATILEHIEESIREPV